ncbi:MAG: MFS transporter [Elusimicrobiota bacterium]
MRNVVRSSLPPAIRESLSHCWKEGVAAQVMFGIFDYYLIPYTLFLGATPRQVGLLVAVPNLLAAVSQFFAVRAVRLAGDRRLLLVWGVGLQAAFLVPVALLPFLPVSGKITALIALTSLHKILGGLVGPAWGSLVSDYLPEGQRGQYLGWRARVVSVAGLAGIFGWGLVLAAFKGDPASRNLGFAVLFSAAAACRFVSLYYLWKMVNVPSSEGPESEFTFWMFLRRARESNFVKFIFYVSAMTFATQLAAPFFSVYMLEDLRFGYGTYTAVHAASAAASLVAFPLWGRHMDAVGAAKVLKSTGMAIPLIPLLWMFARGPASLFVLELAAGFVWSGFNLAATNFIFDAVSPPKRVRCLAYFNLITGAAIFAGAWAGGLLAERLPPLLGSPLISLFLLSALGRLAADLLLSRRFHEVRASAKKISSGALYLSVAGLRPLAGRNVEPEAYPDLRPPRRPPSA